MMKRRICTAICGKAGVGLVPERLFREDRTFAPRREAVPGARAHLDNALGVLAMVNRQIAHHKEHGGKEQCFEHKYLYTVGALTERCARVCVMRV